MQPLNVLILNFDPYDMSLETVIVHVSVRLTQIWGKTDLCIMMS